MSETAPSKDAQQIEAARFRSAVSESLAQKLQANINYLLQGAPGLGTVEFAFLDEATFDAQKGGHGNWVLCDGRDVSSSAYALLTGFTTVPDMRGRYPRMKDHGAGVDTLGNLALASNYNDRVGPHSHNVKTVGFGGGPESGILFGDGGNPPAFNINGGKTPPHGAGGCRAAAPSDGGFGGYSGSNTLIETNVRTTVLNAFIRVD